MTEFYKEPSTMEPLFPENIAELEQLSITLIEKASALSKAIHPVTGRSIADFLRPMNSYYTNLIEGHDTHPIDIEKALKEDFSKDSKNRSLQLEAKAHIKLSKDIFDKFNKEKINPYSIDFIKNVHKEFYDHLPEEFRIAKSLTDKDVEIIPGELRTCEVQVGRHIAPHWASLPLFLDRFESFYNPTLGDNTNNRIRRIITIAASHHRLAWIHPFADGNGRVVRLFSDACLINEHLNETGLWSMSRGLARNENKYKVCLANADSQRWNDYDGRGNLSNKALLAFCKFFLETAIDQVVFMTGVLDIDNMLKRIHSFVDLMVSKKELKTETRYILENVFLKGEITKKEAERLTGKSDKTAKLIAESLIKKDLLKLDSSNHLSPYRVSYPISLSPILFPGLYPSNKELDMFTKINEN